ncbi:MAG TPA: TonB family protein [Spongiibacteraceae bacterium]|nr:TonB family protein [Spongiibacteraceae bacterium]
MKQLIALFTTLLLTSGFAISANAEPGAPNLSGMAAYEQLRKEYYIGALYLGWPGHDAATILAMPGKRQMELRITADRWPALRFAQMWNQGITINNDGATLNANAMDIVAFTSILKGDLLEGDQLVIETEPNTGTRVTLNGVLVLHSKSSALFNLILNSWIGSRPPSSEFKRDILTLPTTPAGTDLVARYETIRPNDARKKAVVAWGIKPELDTPAATAATTATAVTAAANKTPEPVVPKPVPAIAATPVQAKPATPPPLPKPIIEPITVPAATPQPDPAALAAAQQAKAEKEQQQTELYNQYLGQIRKQVLRHIEYPRRASKEGIEGLVMLRISLDRNGNVTSSEIAQTAHDLLDGAAENAVKKAEPYPKPPEQLEGSQFQILIPVVFKLAQ